MRPLLALAFALLAGAVAPSAAYAELGCDRSSDGPRFETRIGYPGGTQSSRSAVVVCDRRSGGEWVVARRGRLRGPANRRRGREIVDASVGGRRLAWTEAVYDGRGLARADIRLAAVPRRGRVVQRSSRRVIADRGAGPDLGFAEVAISRRGDLAWAMEGDRGKPVVLDPVDSAPRTLAPYGSNPVFENAATLAFIADEAVVSHDFRPLPRREGCPVRPEFRLAAESPTIRVGEAQYVEDEPTITSYVVHRACVRATGEDQVVAQAQLSDRTYHGTGVVAAGRDFVVLASRRDSGAMGCDLARVETRDLVGGRPGRAADTDCELLPRDQPSIPEIPIPSVVVTDAGAPAWFVYRGGDVRLLAVDAAGKVVELDKAGRGELGGLRVEGDDVVWARRGEERRARP